MAAAEELFERLLSIRNHPGCSLKSTTQSPAGSLEIFRRVFSHLALIYTAGIIENMGIGRWPRSSAA
jgi:hypothetical protein